MGGIFGTKASLISDLNFIIQIVILFVLLVSVTFKKRGNFKMHGSLMGLAVVLNAISFFLVMGPSFAGSAGFIRREFYSIRALTVLTHAFIGALAEILGIWVVGEWLLRSMETKACVMRKRVMRGIVSLWFIAIILGIAVYVVYYL